MIDENEIFEFTGDMSDYIVCDETGNENYADSWKFTLEEFKKGMPAAVDSVFSAIKEKTFIGLKFDKGDVVFFIDFNEKDLEIEVDLSNMIANYIEDYGYDEEKMLTLKKCLQKNLDHLKSSTPKRIRSHNKMLIKRKSYLAK